MLILFGFMLGLFVTALPQMIINYHNAGSFTPFVHTNLFNRALESGTYASYYTTYVGDMAEYPSPAVQFIDHFGKELFKTDPFDSTKGFFLWVFRHFPSACCIYLKHLINSITILYTKVYLFHVEVIPWAFFLNCFLYLGTLLGLVAMADNGGWRRWGSYASPLSLLLLPAAAALPGWIDTRYFIHCYLLVYLFLTQIIDYKALSRWLHKHWRGALPFVACLLLLWFLYTSQLLGTLEYGVLTFEGYLPP